MPHNSTTPRKLRVTVELDVTEGPRLRRGTTRDDMYEKFGEPVLLNAAEQAHKAFGLTSQDAKVSVEWGYTWMSVDRRVTTDDLGNTVVL